MIAAVQHRELLALDPQKLAAVCKRKGVPFIDVKSVYDTAALSAAGFRVWRL
jgi:hypothetical protein